MNRDNAIFTILPAGKVRIAFEMRTTTSKKPPFPFEGKLNRVFFKNL